MRWDYDEIMENIVVDMEWKRQMRKLLIHPGRNGFVFVLDRLTGEILSAEKFELDKLGERLRPEDRPARPWTRRR